MWSYARRRALIEGLERRAAADPEDFSRRLRWVGRLGYLAMAGLVLPLAGVVGAFGWTAVTGALGELGLMLFALTGVLLGFVLRALWVRLELPAGVPLQPTDAPELFTWIEEASKKLSAPRIDEIRLTDDLNAGVYQVGRRSTLCVGLPLMRVLTADQLRGLIAHELGHVANDGRQGARVHQQRLRWTQLAGALDEGAMRIVMWPLLRIYLPWFEAWSFVQARRQERRADAGEAQLVGKETAGETLARLAVVEVWFKELFMPRLLDEAFEQGGQLQDLASRMLRALGEPVPASRLAWFLAEQMRRETDLDDTHPALKERLEAIGAGVCSVESLVPDDPADEAFLGRRLGPLLAKLDGTPSDELADRWAEEAAHADDVRDAPRRGARGKPLMEAWHRTLNRGLVEGSEAAAPGYMRLVDRFPYFALAWDRLGRHRLEHDDEAGLEDLRKAIDLDPDLGPTSSMLAADWLRGRGDEEAAERWEARAARGAALIYHGVLSEELAWAESSLPEAVQEALEERARVLPWIGELRFVQVEPPGCATVHVLAVGIRFRWIVRADRTLARLREELSDLWVPGRFEVVDLKDPDWAFLSR